MGIFMIIKVKRPRKIGLNNQRLNDPYSGLK